MVILSEVTGTPHAHFNNPACVKDTAAGEHKSLIFNGRSTRLFSAGIID